MNTRDTAREEMSVLLCKVLGGGFLGELVTDVMDFFNQLGVIISHPVK